MNSPTCPKCDCVKGCQSIPMPCPILLSECIASGQVSAAQIEAHRVLDAAIAQPEQPAEPVAWRVRRIDHPGHWIIFMHYPVDAMNDPEREAQPLYIAQPEQKANFCFRCGKLVSAIHDIHTCTPPVGHTN